MKSYYRALWQKFQNVKTLSTESFIIYTALSLKMILGFYEKKR